MEHTEVSRTLIDRILGRKKDIDKIVKVRRQIITIKKSFEAARLSRRVGTFDNVFFEQKEAVKKIAQAWMRLKKPDVPSQIFSKNADIQKGINDIGDIKEVEQPTEDKIEMELSAALDANPTIKRYLGK